MRVLGPDEAPVAGPGVDPHFHEARAHRIVLRLAPPMALREASETERTSFTVCADAVPAIRPKKADKTATLRFMKFSCAVRWMILA